MITTIFKRTLLLALLFTLTMNYALGQKGEKDHVVTWTPTSLLGTKFNLGYEYTVTDKIGIKVGFGWSLVGGSNISTSFNDNINTNNSNITLDPKFTGFDITPELRFYTGGQAAEKFYIGPFIRYYKYALSEISYEFTDGDGEDRDGNGSFDLSALGGGVILGGQWISDKGFVFGINTGLGFGSGKFDGEVKDISDISPEEYKDLEQDILDEFNSGSSSIFTANDLGVYSTSNSVGINSPRFVVPILRFGLVVGWAF